MARYRGPVGKVSRRLGFGITEKGERILKKRPTPPGMHGQSGGGRNQKVSDYGVRLAEKQKARYVYGMLEKQFRRTFDEAKRIPGETGANLFILLERRLDNVIYRLGLAQTRAQARQLVTHGHVVLNGRKTNIASCLVKQGDVVAVRPQSLSTAYFKAIVEGGRSGMRVPVWLNYDPAALSAEVVAMPRREDAEQGIQEQLIVEYYSR